MNFIQKNSFIDEFIKAYDEELLSLPDSLKTYYLKDIKYTSKDNIDKIKYQADNILKCLPNKLILQNILLDDYKGDVFVEFVCLNNNSVFIFYDNKNNKILTIIAQSILEIVEKGIHPDLMEYQVVEISNGQIKGLANKFNVPDFLERANNTKNIINDLYNKMGIKGEIDIRSINNHNIYKFKIFDSIESYYDSFLFSLFFKNHGKVPLFLQEDKEEDYKKRFFKDSPIKDCNIDDYFENFKNIYEMLKNVSGLKVYPQMFKEDGFSNMVNTTPYLEIVFDDNFFYNLTFHIIVKDGLNVENILDEYIHTNIWKENNINFEKTNLFTVKDLIENKDEMLKYLKTMEY